MTAPLRLKPFTPGREDPAELLRRTVGRQPLVDRIVQRLTNAATSDNRTHSLIIGPRGAGKSHVVELVVHEVSRNADLANLAVARLAEDAIGISSVSDILHRLIGELDNSDSTMDAARHARAAGDTTELINLLNRSLGDRVLLATLENLSRIFAALGVEGQRTLRAWVETNRNVVLLATAPLLIESLDSRDAPWFGSFVHEHLEDLTPAEGHQLLLALHHDDPEFVSFLQTESAMRRLEALHHLAGGSPRIWMIAALAASVRSLDELVPAVEDMLERLVPYYQERLWELPGNEQKLIERLAMAGTATVSELAEYTGIGERTAATALGRLAKSRWVMRVKLPSQDGRKSFYQLREPLVRYHFDYRSSSQHNSPLRLIVELLRIWFDPDARLQMLGTRGLASDVESHVTASLADARSRYDASYVNRDLGEMRANARLWANGENLDIGDSTAGRLLSAIIDLIEFGPDLPSLADGLDLSWAFEERERLDESLPDADVFEHLMKKALTHVKGETADVIGIIAACWRQGQPERSLEELQAIPLQGPERRNLVIRNEIAYLTGQTGDHNTAVALLDDIIADLTRTLGPDHPDTLSSRHNHAYWTGQTGDHAMAFELQTELSAAAERALGQRHPTTQAIDTQRLISHVMLAKDRPELVASLPPELQTLVTSAVEDAN